jgi:hypothetical protein
VLEIVRLPNALTEPECFNRGAVHGSGTRRLPKHVAGSVGAVMARSLRGNAEVAEET